MTRTLKLVSHALESEDQTYELSGQYRDKMALIEMGMGDGG